MTDTQTSPDRASEPDMQTEPPSDLQSLVSRARALSPHLSDDDEAVSPIRGGVKAARERLNEIDPIAYGRTRNHLDGSVTQLSPFIRHGVVSLAQVRDRVLTSVNEPSDAEKMVQQLAWRDYWQRLYADMGEGIWDDREEWKTGFSADDYADELPEDIRDGQTGVAAIDHFIQELITTGWLHNHARLYLASYICHFRRVKWQVGARFFLKHLLDGDVASNNLSWQWVASTFANKPYNFNLENLQKFCDPDVDTSYHNNKPLAGTYEDLHLRLFPNLDPPVPQSGGKKKGKRK